MSRLLPSFWLSLAVCAIHSSNLDAQPPDAQPQVPRARTAPEAKAHAEKLYSEIIGPALKRVCISCHSDAKANAGLNFQKLKPDFMSADSGEMWRRIYERLRDQEMPPRPPDEPPLPYDSTVDEARRKVVDAIYEAVSEAQRLKEQAAPPEPRVLVIREEDSPQLRLRKQIRNNAREQLSIIQEEYQTGRVTLDYVMESTKMLRQAQWALATTHQERIAVLENALADARTVDEIVYTQMTLELVDVGQFAKAKYGRLKAQLQLQIELERK